MDRDREGDEGGGLNSSSVFFSFSFLCLDDGWMNGIMDKLEIVFFIRGWGVKCERGSFLP